MSDVNKEQVVEFISNMTVLELSEFIKELEEKFGVSAAAPAAAMVMAAPAAGGAAEAAEEKTEFDVILKDAGANKIGVIKPASASRKPRKRWTAAPPPSRKACPRKKPKKPRSSSPKPALLSKSSSCFRSSLLFKGGVYPRPFLFFIFGVYAICIFCRCN